MSSTAILSLPMSKLSPEDFDLSCSATIFDIPKTHRHCTFDNFRWPSEGIKQAVIQYLQKKLDGEQGNLLAIGTPGLGKTHLAVSLYRWGVKHLGGTDYCALVNGPKFVDLVKQTFGRGDHDTAPSPFLELSEVRSMVILDDLLGRKYTSFELESIIFHLINTLHASGASMVVTANHTPEQMNAILQPHEMSRILEKATVLNFTGRDQRPLR